MSTIEIEVMAHRYLYYVKCAPVIGDREYDFLEKYALSVTRGPTPLHRPGSDSEGDYYQAIKDRAMELQETFS